MLSYYKIPSNVNYVQFVKEIETWEKLTNIDYNTPTVIVIDDSKACHYTRFVVVYKGMMQMQGGSGSCYNPTKPTFMYGNDPMDNKKMEKHMSKWVRYSHMAVLQLVVAAKYKLLEIMGYRDELPFFYWNCEGYNDLIGILIVKLDMIGMGKASPNIIKEVKTKTPLLLSA